MIIAIDGPVAAGKTTVANQLASTFEFSLLDTGAIYRSVALACREHGIDFESADLVEEPRAAFSAQIEIDKGDIKLLARACPAGLFQSCGSGNLDIKGFTFAQRPAHVIEVRVAVLHDEDPQQLPTCFAV